MLLAYAIGKVESCGSSTAFFVEFLEKEKT